MPVTVGIILLSIIAAVAVFRRGRPPIANAIGAILAAMVWSNVQGPSAIITYVQVAAACMTVILLFMSLRTSRWAVLRQFWFEMGLLLLATVAMVASMFVRAASGIEKSMVMLSVYSAALLLVAGTVRMAIMLVRTSRATKQTSGRH